MDLIPCPYYWPGTDTVWGNSPPLGTRSGWLALACMPFLFATASKANWITLVTGVTHEKLQTFHRWIAYAFLVLALMHTFPFIVWHIHNGDMVDQFTVSNIFEYWTGIVALLFQAWLTFASWGPFRSLGYEFFKTAHFISAAVFMVVFFWHCSGTLTSWDYFVATAAVYVPCWAYPWLRTLFEYGLGQKAQISIEENGFARITIPANFEWQPGQHCFLRFPGFGLVHALSSHPFTICSLPSTIAGKQSEMVFYIRPQGGLTKRLYHYAENRPGASISVLVDGPYGGIDSQKFFGSDRLVVAAGGSGAGWLLPFVEQYLRCHSPGVEFSEAIEDSKHENNAPSDTLLSKGLKRVPTSIRVILATRDIPTRVWFHTTLNDLLKEHATFADHTNLNIEIHLTTSVAPTIHQASDQTSSHSSSAGDSTLEKGIGKQSPSAYEITKGDHHGRPDLSLIISEETAIVTGTDRSVGVFVCGPLTMQNDARNAVASENLRILKGKGLKSGGCYLHLEHFSWA